MSNLADLTALEARDRIARGEIRALELAEACLNRIEERDPQIGAWAFLDPELILTRARAADEYRQSGLPLGPLHGLPVGVKDIFDTADMPTENGTIIDTGRRPQKDASVVARLRAAGAIVFGKTVTTECAFFSPGKTRNPQARDHTPGGSSSGSAAAVASGMVPLAVGTQTAGSVIRPASYCGVVGFKPSFGLIPRTGILKISRRLDTVGVFGRTCEDAALVTDVLAGYDAEDPDCSLAASPTIFDIASSDFPLAPVFAFVRSPAWSNIEMDCAEGISELVDALGNQCDRVDLPEIYSEAAEAHRRMFFPDMANNLRHYYERGGNRLSEEMRSAIEEGRRIKATDYLSALEWRGVLYSGLKEILNRYDAIVTPAVAGEAPIGLESTGSPEFNVLWSFMGVPAVTVPIMQGEHGLPIGVQLIGRRGYDGRLMRDARRLMQRLAELKQTVTTTDETSQ